MSDIWYACPVCKESYCKCDRTEERKRTYTLETLTCGVCKESFYSVNERNVHMETRHSNILIPHVGGRNGKEI